MNGIPEYDPVRAIEGTYEKLPCGCRMWNQRNGRGEKEFIMMPCVPGCTFFAYALAESRAQDIPIGFRRS